MKEFVYLFTVLCWNPITGGHHCPQIPAADATRYQCSSSPAETLGNNDVVIAPKRRHFDVLTSKWRRFVVITSCVRWEEALMTKSYTISNFIYRFIEYSLVYMNMSENSNSKLYCDWIAEEAPSHYLTQCWPKPMASPGLNEVKNFLDIYNCQFYVKFHWILFDRMSIVGWSFSLGFSTSYRVIAQQRNPDWVKYSNFYNCLNSIIRTEIFSFQRNFHHLLHRKLS